MQVQGRHSKTPSTLQGNPRNTNQRHRSLACPCPSTAGRQSTSRLHKRAWWCTKPLSRASDHGMDTQACGVPCVRVPAYYTWLLAAWQHEQNCSKSHFKALHALCRHTQIIWPFFILVFLATLFHKSGPGPQEIPATDSKTITLWSVVLTATFSFAMSFKHTSQKEGCCLKLKRNTHIPWQTKLQVSEGRAVLR